MDWHSPHTHDHPQDLENMMHYLTESFTTVRALLRDSGSHRTDEIARRIDQADMEFTRLRANSMRNSMEQNLARLRQERMEKTDSDSSSDDSDFDLDYTYPFMYWDPSPTGTSTEAPADATEPAKVTQKITENQVLTEKQTGNLNGDSSSEPMKRKAPAELANAPAAKRTMQTMDVDSIMSAEEPGESSDVELGPRPESPDESNQEIVLRRAREENGEDPPSRPLSADIARLEQELGFVRPQPRRWHWLDRARNAEGQIVPALIQGALEAHENDLREMMDAMNERLDDFEAEYIRQRGLLHDDSSGIDSDEEREDPLEVERNIIQHSVNSVSPSKKLTQLSNSDHPKIVLPMHINPHISE
ncbi:unnamed protein product [Caenorhabditis sp. 36 PRJEB53466]|nr:unnamed protein product [Caenorhabditis sp. 36 PRJEB53466]